MCNALIGATRDNKIRCLNHFHMFVHSITLSYASINQTLVFLTILSLSSPHWFRKHPNTLFPTPRAALLGPRATQPWCVFCVGASSTHMIFPRIPPTVSPENKATLHQIAIHLTRDLGSVWCRTLSAVIKGDTHMPVCEFELLRDPPFYLG